MTTGEVMSALLCCIWLLIAAKQEKEGYLRKGIAASAVFLLTAAVITDENLWAILYYGVIVAGTGMILIQVHKGPKG